ncbi:MarR family winged helix-turn-helix transcriptional regulator [Catenisphaera adipataccumulans]|uniref:DNA-binding MarR family transcriptional regulator n=1 Tax=Catenisphaera adipataccumulans TaxID=700500 RepID=A0A7W8FVE0_9FIRM|nr:MarR family transcriptional regulator [Catenisphaera adipataccumulans]MBB5182096.1 DNA-binding MarR family transcriptional regulator [Catenisphaera adipataccumulans]
MNKIKTAGVEQYHLSARHVHCIYVLAQHPEGITVSELARICGEDKAAISRTVNSLIKKEMAFRDCPDGHCYKAPIKLTEQGKTVAERIASKINWVFDHVGKGISEEQRENFYETLSYIADELEALIDHIEQTNQ